MFSSRSYMVSGFTFILFLAALHGMQDLNALTRDQIHTPCRGSMES